MTKKPKRGNRELRKPKAEKPKLAAATPLASKGMAPLSTGRKKA